MPRTVMPMYLVMIGSPTKTRSVLENQFPGIVERAALGDRDAWSTLYGWVNPGLHRYLKASAGTASGEEILADTFLELGRRLPAFRGGASEFRVLAFTIGRRRMLDRRRFDSRRLPTEATADGRRAAPEAITRFATAAALALPPDQADTVLLCVCGRLLIAEAAQVLGMPTRVVARTAQEGLCKLDDFLTFSSAPPGGGSVVGDAEAVGAGGEL